MTTKQATTQALLIQAITVACLLGATQIGWADFYEYKDKKGNTVLTNIPQSQSTTIRKDALTPSTKTLNNTVLKSVNRTDYTSVAQPSMSVPSAYVPSPEAPSNINYSLNKIEYANAKSLGSLKNKWQSRTTSPVVVAHFGDSHVQLGWKIAPIRRILQQAHGNSGRGMIFPYALAKTYSQEDYTSSFSGDWRTANSIQQPPKMSVGISGFVAKTSDNFSQVNFDFEKADNDLGSLQATVYYRALGGDYKVTASNGRTAQTLSAKRQPNDQIGGVTFDLPNTGRDLSFSFSKANSGAASFELHGVNLTNNTAGGVIYHNLGVGGAAFKALLQQDFFDQQFAALNADLVVLDYGTNDLIYENEIPAGFERMVKDTIWRIRRNNPNAAILLTSVQEADYKGNNVTASAQYATLMRRIAQEENTLFYDWYTIAGGHASVAKWRDAGFASKDAIHLNGKGYRIQGAMIAHALLDVLR